MLLLDTKPGILLTLLFIRFALKFLTALLLARNFAALTKNAIAVSNTMFLF